MGGAAGSTRGSAPPSRGSPSKAPSSLGDAGDVADDAARAHSCATPDAPAGDDDEYAFLDPLEVAKAQANPEFRTLAEWAMEATLFNLVKELRAEAYSTGRWRAADPDDVGVGVVGGVGTGAGWASDVDE